VRDLIYIVLVAVLFLACYSGREKDSSKKDEE